MYPPKSLVAAIVALGCCAPSGAAEGPYTVTVWARVLFGADGKVAEYTVVDADQYPARFVDELRSRVAAAKIPPPRDGDRAVTLRSGVRLQFQVTPGPTGGTVRMSGLGLGPLPLTTYYASYPRDIAASGGWQGEVTGLCQVSTAGRCSSIEVSALPGIPESVRRHVRASLEGWTFEPQQLDGKAIEGEHTLRLRLNTLDSAPADFRHDKFDRILRTR